MALRIDPGLSQAVDAVPGRGQASRPVAVLRDGAGATSHFVADELVVGRREDLDEVLRTTAGSVVASDEIPSPPDGLEGVRDVDRGPRLWLVRVDPTTFDLESFDDDARAIGADFDTTVSSDAAARLLAMATRLRRQGRDVSLNFVAFPDALPFTSSTEGFGVDAFTLPEFQPTGNKSSVTLAWQFFQAYNLLKPIGRRIRVAIIDSGYWLDPNGVPMSQEGGKSDLPAAPIQYDFVDDDRTAGGANPVANSQGSPAPWHGNRSASVAVATINNGAGAAGTGGLIADPMLFKIDMTHTQTARALRTATAWGADVVNMSFGAATSWWWRTFAKGNYTFAFEEARGFGVIVVASAGNDSQNVDDNDVYPCTAHSSVVCVGAIDNATKSMSYSNWGGSVDIWAPTNITAMPDGSGGGNTVHGGTSAAAPFVSGVAAMMRAIDPKLFAELASDALARSGWRDSPDPVVPVFINAYAALLDVAQRRLPPDRFEQNTRPSSAIELTLVGGAASLDTLAISSPGDQDWFRFTTDDIGSVDVDIDFLAALGNLSVEVLGVDSQLGMEGAAAFATATGFRFHADLIPAGTWSIIVRGAGPNVYELRVNTGPATLPPDPFEANDDLASATHLAAPPFGSWTREANLHAPGDVDFFHLDQLKVEGAVRFDFAIVASDTDLTLQLFDDAGRSLRTVGPARNPKVQMGAGASTVCVSSAAGRRARYVFTYGYTITDSHIRDGLRVKRALLFDPGDPAPRWLEGQEQVLVFEATALLTRGRSIELDSRAADLRMTLLDRSGSVLAESAASGGVMPRQVLSLAGLREGELYAIRIRRTAHGSTAADPRELRRYALKVR